MSNADESSPSNISSAANSQVGGALGPRVGICMGSTSDLATMEGAAEVLDTFRVAHEIRVLSAHRTPDAMLDYGKSAIASGLEVIIAGAGGAAHLPGMLASVTVLPVIGVPVPIGHLQGVDALLSIVQMPTGTPVATVAVGNARNAAFLALRILAVADTDLRARLRMYREQKADAVRRDDASLRGRGHPSVA